MYKHCRLLPSDELDALAVRAKNVRDTDARARLVEAVWPMVCKWAAFRARFDNRQIGDLTQEGALAVLYAAARFKIGKARFTTYLSYALRTFFHKHDRLMAPVTSLPYAPINSTAGRFIVDAMRRAGRAVDLNRVGGDFEPEAREDETEAEYAEQCRNRQRFAKYLEGLNGIDREILTRRMNGETLRSIGDSIGLTKERVRQKEARAIQRARRALANN